MRVPVALIAVLTGCSHNLTPQPADETLVRAKALECGITADQLKFEVGRDGKREWLIGPSKKGDIPSFKSFQCFTVWAMNQKGVRIGFISEPPPPPETRQ
jgi:hypothetical protein